jgi:hypothetical protein
MATRILLIEDNLGDAALIRSSLDMVSGQVPPRQSKRLRALQADKRL